MRLLVVDTLAERAADPRCRGHSTGSAGVDNHRSREALIALLVAVNDAVAGENGSVLSRPSVWLRHSPMCATSALLLYNADDLGGLL